MTLVAEIPMLEASMPSAWRTEPVPPRPEARPSRVHSSESTRALLGLLKLSQTAAREMANPADDSTFAGVISKGVLRSLLGTLHHRHTSTLKHSRRGQEWVQPLLEVQLYDPQRSLEECRLFESSHFL